MRNIFNWYLVMAVFVIVFVAAVSITPASAQIFVTDILVSDGSGDFGEIPDDMRAPVSAPDHDCMAAMMSGVSGQVLVEYTVNPDGSVSDAVVLGLHHSEQEMVVANPYLPDRMLEAEFPAKPEDRAVDTAWLDGFNAPAPDEPIVDEGTQVADCSRWKFFGNNTRICGNKEETKPVDGTQIATDWRCYVGGDHYCNKPEEGEADDEWGAYFAEQALALIDKYEFEEDEETSERQQIILSMGYP